MAIHGSKSKLKWLSYVENHEKYISMLPEVITFDLTVEFSISLVFWKLDIQIFLVLSQSNSRKTFKYASKVETGKG